MEKIKWGFAGLLQLSITKQITTTSQVLNLQLLQAVWWQLWAQVTTTSKSNGSNPQRRSRFRLVHNLFPAVTANWFPTKATTGSRRDYDFPQSQSTTFFVSTEIQTQQLGASSPEEAGRWTFYFGDDYPTGHMLPHPNLRIFTFAELRNATKNFKLDTMLGDGGFGKVYKAWIDDKGIGKSGSANVD
ncbi:hypothetical protein ACFE04_011595 [Oxalis oulophora]